LFEQQQMFAVVFVR